MIPYFSLEMLRALLELCGSCIPAIPDMNPVSSNPVKMHSAARASIRSPGGWHCGPESSANASASRPDLACQRPSSAPLAR